MKLKTFWVEAFPPIFIDTIFYWWNLKFDMKIICKTLLRYIIPVIFENREKINKINKLIKIKSLQTKQPSQSSYIHQRKNEEHEKTCTQHSQWLLSFFIDASTLTNHTTFHPRGVIIVFIVIWHNFCTFIIQQTSIMFKLQFTKQRLRMT